MSKQAIFGHWGPHLAGMALVPSILGAVVVVAVVSFFTGRSLLSPIIHYIKEFRKAERTRLEKEKATNAQKNRSHTYTGDHI
jgi:hypothetical protein